MSDGCMNKGSGDLSLGAWVTLLRTPGRLLAYLPLPAQPLHRRGRHTQDSPAAGPQLPYPLLPPGGKSLPHR